MTQEEFKSEVRRIRPELMAQARRYLGEEEAEDIVQDVLLRLWQMVGELHRPLAPLALRLVRNFSIDQLRRKRPAVPLVEMEEGSAQDNSELLDEMMRLVATLPDMQQVVLRLRHMEGMRMSEIALLTGSTETALRKALCRARKAERQKRRTRESRGQVGRKQREHDRGPKN